MELSRRDALAALTAVGLGATAGCASSSETDARDDDDHVVETLVAVAEAVYPSEVDGVESFVREVSVRRIGADEAYEAGVADAVERLDDYVEGFRDATYTDLSREERTTELHRMGVGNAAPDPSGLDRERVRYYLVNELLYAFYSTPTGASLVGLENPPGHPGGTTSYRRGPEE
ncbi:hypothetical protein [Halogranum rubrum]|uniref:Gluconate 2-dehydrogenase subunit 3 family protein n=1 Tax=Halogranum salarium B-1 TaxID=1210908 RepID=J2ZEQ4_9EURY|nr:hypothetical protein [Halogranum salarium]EJN59155.1 hypothetical protein HSB1_25760 [Halogranum salarium B-1]